jgi:glycosyltransferase involved in cell wall biosynthesis
MRQAMPLSLVSTARTTLRVSVVVATYNGAKFLPIQLASILNQKRRPDEIVISDDNSSDDTMRIIREFSDKSPIPVVVIRNVPGLGFADNFLQAADQATGDIIAFCDQDDVWHPKKLQVCAGLFDDRNVSLVTHRANLIDAEGKHIGVFDQGITCTVKSPPLSYDLWGLFWGFSIVFRRDLLRVSAHIPRFRDYINPMNSISHDRWITFLAQILGNIVEIEDRLVDYRQHQNNLYGVGKSQTIAKAAVYLEVTRCMLNIVDEIDSSSESLFPLFDRAQAKHFVGHALLQQEARSRSYTMRPVGALRQISLSVWRGVYRSAHDKRMRYRSLAKDLRIAFMRRST